MCTAATYKTKDFYIGRTLDYEISYGDEITITPRNYEFKFKEKEPIKTHNTIIGMAYVVENYPLYYVDLGQVFRHIFSRIFIDLSSFAWGVVINIKENL